MSEIHTRVDENTIKIETALLDEVNNIAEELEKSRREKCSNNNPHLQYMHALTMAEHPIKEAIIQIFLISIGTMKIIKLLWLFRVPGQFIAYSA